MYARETLVGFPLHVKSPARRRPLLQSKSAAPKRKTPVGVSFFLEQGTGIEPASSAWEADVLPMYEPCKWNYHTTLFRPLQGENRRGRHFPRRA